MNIRIGQGFDVHAWGHSASFVILGGVRIPHHRTVKSHSDGDVILHALCDALLGAAGLGDIGEHFPDHDPQYKNAASSTFVRNSLHMLQQRHWAITNVDISVLAESPKLTAYKPVIRTHIADLLEIQEQQVNIKATTMESLGTIGREEGIAAMAVVLLTND